MDSHADMALAKLQGTRRPARGLCRPVVCELLRASVMWGQRGEKTGSRPKNIKIEVLVGSVELDFFGYKFGYKSIASGCILMRFNADETLEIQWW